MDPSSSSSSSSKCETINNAVLPPLQPRVTPPPSLQPRPTPPPPSDCENNKLSLFPPPALLAPALPLGPLRPPPPLPPPACLNNEDLKFYESLRKSSSDCEEFRDGDAEEEELGINLIKAAMNGDTQIFDEPNLSFGHFSTKGVIKDNILHVALRYEQREFVTALLSKEKYKAMNKKLISERNSHGNTPFHLAAQLGHKDIVELLYGLYKYMKKKRVEGGHHDDDDDDDDGEKPWRSKNSEGNTALHVALLSGNFFVAKYLVERDGGLAGMVNNSQEAPLHLAISHLDSPFGCIPMTKVLLEKARCVATWRDAKGLTPLLRAASLLDPFVTLKVTKNIIDVCPESTLVCDSFGKSFLHLLIHNKMFDRLHPKNLDKQVKCNYQNIKDLICLNEISILKNHQDQDGHTPLHIALICGNIHMARSLVSKCSADPYITNKDGISAWSMIQQLNLSHQLREPRTMTKEETNSANKGDINFLLDIQRKTGIEFYGSQDSRGRNFLHLLMSKTTEHHYLSSSDDCCKFFRFTESALVFFPKLVCQTDQMGNTPLHILAQNKDLCKTLADPKLSKSRSLLSTLLFNFAQAITRIKLMRTAPNEADNHNLPWVMQNSSGNTPLHKAIIANNKVMVLELLRYGKESTGIVNKHKKTPLHLLAATSIGTMEFTVEEIMEIVNANIEALELPDEDGLIPISTALKAENQQMVVAILRIVRNYSDNDGKNPWHLVLNHSSRNFVNDLLQNEAFRNMLKQKDKDGYTPLHIAMKEKCFEFVENIFETRGREQQLSGGQQRESNQWLMDLLKILDKDGLTPILRALNVDNPNLAIRLCHVNPEAAETSDIDGQTIWHLLSTPQSYKSENVKQLLKSEALRKVLIKKDKKGNTPLHHAIKEKCSGFVQDLLEASVSGDDEFSGDPWPMDLFKTPDNIGETPENLLAELSTLPEELEKILLTDPRTRGIRSSWGIPRTQLQNYMSSMNVIAALQTTITFTAAFTVPGGLSQEIGTPILIRRIAFQVFMISDVIAMCLSMMVLICLLWMVATNKRDSVIIQDSALTLLLASFVATLLTFMTGVYATIYPAEPWIAITTLVLCSLLMLFLHRYMLTKLLLLFKYCKGRFVKMFSQRADSSNTQEQRFDSAV